jgi:hypothetical protein
MMFKANANSGYLWRLLLLACFCIGISLWFLYDGAIGYPRQRERALAYLQLEEENRLDEWDELAQERGWPTKNPGEPKTEYDSYVQFAIAALAFPVGLLYLGNYFRWRRRWIESNGTAIRTSWGKEFELDQIVVLNKKKWKNKGIAKIQYVKQGRKGRLVLDDCKYEVEPTEGILRQVEAHVDPSQIIGGQPEPPRPPEGADSDAAPTDLSADAPGSVDSFGESPDRQ